MIFVDVNTCLLVKTAWLSRLGPTKSDSCCLGHRNLSSHLSLGAGSRSVRSSVPEAGCGKRRGCNTIVSLSVGHVALGEHEFESKCIYS